MRIVFFSILCLFFTKWSFAQENGCPSIGSMLEFGIKQDIIIKDNALWFSDLLDSGFVINYCYSLKAFADSTCLLEFANKIEKDSKNYQYRCCVRSSSFIWANMNQWVNIDSVFEDESTNFLQLKFFHYNRSKKACEITISIYSYNKVEDKYTSRVKFCGYGLCELKP